ncbi:3-deoxy-manno-octulosonate-8-phosphatase KdsC [Succinimonas amylolytica]|uniref:3-deoxy-manno-octulosonate-8-phosphatase KdsC n=1 Tax=Succinimonas amylolytica TaxID=83769 RepID=UPI00037DE3B7|nr:3-deoxy-manno-octulosonate-8-phosphatase KdsC [Succinimonas amylolytica]
MHPTLYSPVSDDFYEKLTRIRFLFCDVDGVLSDGSVYLTNSGDEIKAFNAKDGYGLVALQHADVKIGIITGRQSILLERRAGELGIDYLAQGVKDKISEMRKMLHNLNIEAVESAYIGDDVPDIPVMNMAGVSFCPGDGHPLVKATADYVCTMNGGKGAVREVCDLIMQAHGKLEIPGVASV